MKSLISLLSITILIFSRGNPSQKATMASFDDQMADYLKHEKTSPFI